MSNYKKDLVSICIPTFNRAKLIGELLESILIQTYSNFEVIITDNSNNYETKEIFLTKFKDKRIKYYKNDFNLGMGGNSLKAFSHVKGEFFTFTADDDIWTDKYKLEKQISFLQNNIDIDIVYSNAMSIGYDGQKLKDFYSVYDNNKSCERLDAIELLPGNNTAYFLNILTTLLRTENLIGVFNESWRFDSEEYLCYYISSIHEKIGFIYDKTVALRETEHHRTTIEDGNVVDWKKRKDIRIRQIFNIYNTLTAMHPDSKIKLETPKVQNNLAKHVIGQAKAARSVILFLQTIAACNLFFRKISLAQIIRIKRKVGKSFG